MKKTYLLILLTVFLINVNAQYDVDWGPTYKKEGGMFSTYYLAGATADNYNLIMRPKKDNTMLTFDYNHKLVKTTTVPFTFDGKSLSPTNFIETKAGVFAYLGHYDKKKSTMYEFVSKMEGANKFGKLKNFNQYEYKVKVGAFFRMGYGFGGSFDEDVSTLETSPERNFVLIAKSTSLTESKKSKEESMDISVYDENFDVIWSKTENFNGQDDQDIDIVQFFIDNEGNVYAGAKIWRDREDREKGELRYDYKVYKITENNLEEYEITIDDNNLPKDLGIFYGEDRNIYLGGLYTRKGKGTHQANGVFYTRVNPEKGEVVDSKYYEFDAELLEGLIRDKAVKKGKGLSKFRVEHMIFSENGDFSFIAEEYYITQHTRTSNGRTYTYYEYHSNEIIIPRFSKDGDLINIQKIDKDFSSENGGLTSYTIGTFGDKTYLVFNDRKSLAERKGGDVKGGRKSRFTDLAVIDEEGELSFWETLFSNKEIETEFYPSLSKQVQNSNILLLHGAKKKEYQFGTIIMD